MRKKAEKDSETALKKSRSPRAKPSPKKQKSVKVLKDKKEEAAEFSKNSSSWQSDAKNQKSP